MVLSVYFRSYKPPPPLSDFVENLWAYSGFESPRLKERIFPSGTFELVFNLREDEMLIYKDSRCNEFQRCSGAIVSGPYSSFFVTDTAKETSVMGVHFKPGGAFLVLGPLASELADRHIDVRNIWGRTGSEIRERLCETASPQGRMRLLRKFLLSRLLRPFRRHSAVASALAAHDRARSQMTRELAREACLSERRFIDVFRREVGLKPRLFHRIYRFQRVLARVHQSSERDWAGLALEHGYFDQSHLIRDFLFFSGLSPADYVRRLDNLGQHGLHAKFNHLPLAQ